MLCSQPFNGFGCGQCTPCRINRRRIAASRVMLEAGLHGDNSFLTLTYEDSRLPLSSSLLPTLYPKHLQLFFKRFRKTLGSSTPIRYYAVGEYGDISQRPHYHAALFGYGCAGKITRPETGLRCYCERCELILSAWQYGNITADELNDTTAAYIAGYVLKKMTSKEDIRLNGRYPEFARMSQGIGRGSVDFIADALNGEYGHRAFQLGDVPVSLRTQGKSVPLGRYLRTRLRKKLGIEKVNPDTGEITYGTPHETLRLLHEKENPEMSALQKAYFADPLSKKEKLYEELDSLKAKKTQKRKQRILNLEAKHRIHNSRKDKQI